MIDRLIIILSVLLITLTSISLCDENIKTISEEELKLVKDDVAVVSKNCINISDDNVISRNNNHLDTYMKLPMERLETIPFAHGTKLEKSKTSELSNYELVAPPVQFLHLKVNPRVYTNITQTDYSILITSHKCELSGSTMIENINKCFKFRVDTKFTWDSIIDNNIESKRQLCSASSVVVEINPPSMFSFIPKKLLEQTANLVISVTMNSLEEGFLSSLHDDYIRWANKYEVIV